MTCSRRALLREEVPFVPPPCYLLKPSYLLSWSSVIAPFPAGNGPQTIRTVGWCFLTVFQMISQLWNLVKKLRRLRVGAKLLVVQFLSEALTFRPLTVPKTAKKRAAPNTTTLMIVNIWVLLYPVGWRGCPVEWLGVGCKDRSFTFTTN